LTEAGVALTNGPLLTRMYFFDELTASVRDQGVALGKLIVTTEPTPRQEKTKKALEKVYGVACNLFFLAIIVLFVLFLFVQFAGDRPGLVPVVWALADKLSYPALAAILLATVAAFLLLLRAMLYLFKYISAVELVKFTLFLELINLACQYISEPRVQPVPFLVEMLKKIFRV